MYTCIANDYRIAGKFDGGVFGEFGESSMICQIKTIQISFTINNLLADLLIRQIIFAKCSKRVNSLNFPPAKLSHYTVCVFMQTTEYEHRPQ